MIYLFVIIVCLFFILKFDFCKSCNKGKRVLFIIIVLVSLLAGFRYMIGADTENYYELFKRSSTKLDIFSLGFNRFQPGYLFIITIIKSITNYFFILQLVVAFFLNFTLYFFIVRHSNFLFTTCLFYFIINYLEFNTEIQRESIAISFGLIAFMCYENSNYMKAIFFAFLAFEFHISAIVVLFYPLLSKVRFSNKSFFIVFILICFVAPAIYVAIPNLFDILSLFMNFENWNVEEFLGQELLEDYNIVFYVIHTTKYVLLPFFIIYYNEKRRKTSYVGFVYLWCALQFLNIYSYGFYRFANYLAPFVWVYFSLFIISIIKSHFYKHKMIVIVSFSVLLLWFYQGSLLHKDGGFLSDTKYRYERYFPYKSIFTEKMY